MRTISLKKSLLFAVTLLASAQSFAMLTLADYNGWKFSTYGYIETDFISDSTRSYRETIGNSPVERSDNATGVVASNGSNGRMQSSVRNSTFGFILNAPNIHDFKVKGVFDFDLLGYDPAPGTTNTEGLFNASPTIRDRHAYFVMDDDNWKVLAGMTWSLFGWQAAYITPTIDSLPLPGSTFNRSPQVRGVKTFHLENKTDIQAALAVVKPPQSDSDKPDLQGGARVTFGNRTAAYAGGAQRPDLQPMSLALTGLTRTITVPTFGAGSKDTSSYNGHAWAADLLVPILASTDNKSASNNLVFTAEFTTGTGYGDQFSGWTGNTANPLNSTGTAPQKPLQRPAQRFWMAESATTTVQANFI